MPHTFHYPVVQTLQGNEYSHAQDVKKSSPALSPRQQFQSRIRHLSDDGEEEPNPASSPKQEQKLQHISSLRVQAMPNTTKQKDLSHRARLKSSRGRTVRAAHDEPAFILEEREAWNRRSPARTQVWQHQETDDRQTKPTRDVYCDDQDFRLSETKHEAIEPEQHTPLLRHFTPLSSIADIEDRPKTSKGPRSSAQELSIQEDRPTTGNTIHSVRRSKFVEGSMNDRSVAIASCWQNPTYSAFPAIRQRPNSIVAETDQSSNTPGQGRESDSLDINEFKPLPTAPVGSLKQRFFNFGNSARPAEDSHKVTEDQQPNRLKKRLRKSVSSWNLGKMKIFGASTQELEAVTNDTHEPINKLKTSTKDADAEVMQERKRKAQEAYSQQFGFKKQKSNAGLPNVTNTNTNTNTNSSNTTPSKQRKPRLTKERSLSAIRSSLTAAPASSITTIRPKTPQIDPFLDTKQDLDLTQRQSRKQLEKENQRLRTLLREQNQDSGDPTNIDTQRYRSASISSIHLPLDQTQAMTAVIDPQKKPSRRSHQQQQDIVPPLPPLPVSKVLSQLTNERNLNHGQISVGGAVNNNGNKVKKKTNNFSRPVSMIMEVDEGDENRVMGQYQVQGREQWEWPDDVF